MYDVVLGSDVLFYRGAAPHVAKVIAKSIKLEGCALIADPVRLNVDDFCSRLNDLGYSTEIRTFTNAADVIDEVGKFGKDKDAFVQLKLAKLVVVRNTKATTQHPIAEAVMAFTEAFVEE
jgi:hypothetical protein